jgi:hypothetical protein
MYASVEDVRALLPGPITIGNQNIGTPNPIPGLNAPPHGANPPGNANPPAPGLHNKNSESHKSIIHPEEVIRYIRFADNEINSRLRFHYVCPLRRVKIFETEILENVTKGNSAHVKIHDTGVFSMNQMVRIQDKRRMETSEVENVRDLTTLILRRVKYDYLMYDSYISILAFPDPIPLISARLAASYIFDRLFSADQSPNESQYGAEERKLAINAIDSIITGTITLFGQDYVGNRFVRGTLHDAYTNPVIKDFQFGREKQ